MRIDRASFLALALGGGFALNGCGTTRPAAAPIHQGGDMEPNDEGYGMDAPPSYDVEPTFECVEWDPTDECVSWEEVPTDPSLNEE